MIGRSRLFYVLLVALAATLALGQGGAAGYGQGQGGPGGGGFGTGGGRADGLFRGGAPSNSPIDRAQDDKKARPDEDDAPGLWNTKTAILTPGDRVEFKFKMRKGETLLASATIFSGLTANSPTACATARLTTHPTTSTSPTQTPSSLGFPAMVMADQEILR